MLELKTKIWKLSNDTTIKDPAILEIAEGLRKGQVIAFPTETVYGLGANALDSQAVKNIFKAKGRPNDNPLIVHIATLEQLYSLVGKVDEKTKLLINHFWPGPLTIVFERRGEVSDYVTAGLDTIAVRMPDHPVALHIIEAAKIPVAAPSANRSGKPSPTTALHVMNDLNGLIDGIVDAGPTGVGVESTVIDVRGEVPLVLRPGGVTIEQLEQVLGKVEIDPAILEKGDQPRSPGMKYKHYAPTGEMWIVKGDTSKVVTKINELAAENRKIGKKVGILTSEDHKELYNQSNLILAYGTEINMYPLAEKLYDALRTFDHQGIDAIFVEGVDEKGIGLTIMNRLNKAAAGNILELK